MSLKLLSSSKFKIWGISHWYGNLFYASGFFLDIMNVATMGYV